MRKIIVLICIFLLSSIVSLLFGQSTSLRPTRVGKAVYFDISPSLLDMPMVKPDKKASGGEEEWGKQIPNKIGKKEFLHLQTTPFNLPEDPYGRSRELPTPLYLPPQFRTLTE